MKRILITLICFLFSGAQALFAQQKDSTTERVAQVSFIYPVGTNGMESYKYLNHFSLNLLGGINGGINGFELGGLFNINKGNITGAQIGGLFNISSGNVNGAQIGGLVNVNTGTVIGSKTSGIVSLQSDDVRGSIGSGIASVSKGNLTGFEGSGIVNTREGDINGMQAAGIININKGNVKGLQSAGIINISSGTVKGIQMAPILNIASKVNGLQIGLINIADSSDAPLGLVNLSKSGNIRITVNGNDLGTTTAALKSGGRRTYGIIGFGYNTFVSNIRWSTTAGLGIHSYLSQKLLIDWELAVTNHYKRLDVHDRLNLLAGFRPLLAYNFTKRAGIYAGPSINYYITNAAQNDEVPSYTVWDNKSSKNNQYIWLGAVAGIQFKIN